MMKKEFIGERIRSRRKALKLTQQALAKGIGVSHVAVSQWEKEETVPRGENLLRLAEWLQCTAAWIMDGDGEVFAAPLAVSNVKALPLISLTQAAEWLHEQRLVIQQQATRFVYSDYPLSELALGVTLEDGSMQPDYRPGDTLIFDPAVAPQPGDGVLANVNGVVHVRIFRLVAQLHDEQCFSLRPLNEDFPTFSSSDHDVQLIGTLMEMRRYRAK
ncbi:helix-turn-helix domain-containing protein [Erwinia sp. S63]|uniref:helix-turn-helix domain-containing protein n=1 Tax=Erwinia sp. S63 TaxID=2769341 RepID=UPI00190B830A|nr:helix-turn-helix domain-containing protein [Erwinia sp. S63]MBK0094724.1 helix-turn-helix domain-containing protein [Erwinia sp. S63]